MNKLNMSKILRKRLKKRGKAAIFIVIFVILANVANPTLAKELDKNLVDVKAVFIADKQDIITENMLAYQEKQEQAKQRKITYQKAVYPKYKSGELYVTATAYTSSVAETDSTPCITADGYNVCVANEENIIAANFLPFGTKVKIPDLYGDQEFIVHDRMNRRYSNRVDIWMKDHSDAIQFGKKQIKIEIIE